MGAGGEIKLRVRLPLTAAAARHERVGFRGRRVNMELDEHILRSWETLDPIPGALHSRYSRAKSPRPKAGFAEGSVSRPFAACPDTRSARREYVI